MINRKKGEKRKRGETKRDGEKGKGGSRDTAKRWPLTKWKKLS
jgi:hypothetical protein